MHNLQTDEVFETHNQRDSIGFITLWGSFCQHSLGPLPPLEGWDPANQYEVRLPLLYGETFLS